VDRVFNTGKYNTYYHIILNNQTLNKMLEIKENEKYQHYKGGIYYKLAECIISDDLRETNSHVKMIEEAVFEATCEPMLILADDELGLWVCFKDRESEPNEFLEDVVLYVHENDDKIWVRLEEVFHEEVKAGVKRFTKID